MARKPTYDSEPLNRFGYNPTAVEEVTERIHEQAVPPLNETLDALAGDLAVEHGITEEVAALWLTHQAKYLLDEQRTFRAAQAHRAGTPKTAVAEALGWRGGAAPVIRRMPDLDDLAARIPQAQQGKIQPTSRS